MEIYYNNKLLKDGEVLKVSETQDEPKIKFNVNNNDFYTLIIHDPDALGGSYIHWAIINITNNDIKTGNIIIPYKGPAPPPGTGKHRYIFGLYQQDRDIFVESINERQMELNNLENILKVSNPIVETKFISQNEIGGKKRKPKTKRRRNKRFKKTRRY